MRAVNRVPARHVIASARLRGHGHRLCRPRGAVRVRDGAEVRWTAAALVAGLVVFEVTSTLHVTGPDLNDNAAIFRTYAASDGWVAVHLGQLAGGLLVLGGLVALYRSWDLTLGIAAAAATAASL